MIILDKTISIQTLPDIEGKMFFYNIEDDGFPRGGRDVCDPQKRKKIEEITRKWIQ